MPITIPAAAVAEWWRGEHPGLLELGTLEAMTPDLAKRAGELLARTGGSNVVDALVVASAEQRGDITATADPGDLQELANHVDCVSIEKV